MAELSQGWGHCYQPSRQDDHADFCHGGHRSGEKKGFLSHQSFFLHYHYVFLWWITSADTAFNNIYVEKNTVLACCLNGDVSDNKYYYTLQAFHEQQFKTYKDEDEVKVILTMTLFT